MNSIFNEVINICEKNNLAYITSSNNDAIKIFFLNKWKCSVCGREYANAYNNGLCSYCVEKLPSFSKEFYDKKYGLKLSNKIFKKIRRNKNV